jgi:putative thioredoxin
LTQAIPSHPSNGRVALDMVQIFLDIGEIEQAQSLFDRLPEVRLLRDKISQALSI